VLHRPPDGAVLVPDLFSTIDINKDGVIDRREMDAALRAGVVQEGRVRPQALQGPSAYTAPPHVLNSMGAPQMSLDEALGEFLSREGLPRDLVRLGPTDFVYGGERLDVFLSERPGRKPTLKVRSPLYNNGQAVDLQRFASMFEDNFVRPRSPSPSPERPRTSVTVPTTTPEVFKGVSSPAAKLQPAETMIVTGPPYLPQPALPAPARALMVPVPSLQSPRRSVSVGRRASSMVTPIAGTGNVVLMSMPPMPTKT
jgi:hypothetical protein